MHDDRRQKPQRRERRRHQQWKWAGISEAPHNERRNRAQIPCQAEQRGQQRQPVGLLGTRATHAYGRSYALTPERHQKQHRIQHHAGDVSQQID
jgi:hypothetical protein